MSSSVSTVLVLAGSVVFLTGAAIGVPRVFTESDPARRLELLESHRSTWRAAQPLYAIGPLVAAVGVGWLGAAVGAAAGRSWLWLAAVLLFVGALCWAWSVSLRFRFVREFALGELPWWPYASYVWLTLAGLAALGIGLLAASRPSWTGWLTLGATAAYLAWWMRVRDLPPFVFYVLLIVVSLGWT